MSSHFLTCAASPFAFIAFTVFAFVVVIVAIACLMIERRAPAIGPLGTVTELPFSPYADAYREAARDFGARIGHEIAPAVRAMIEERATELAATRVAELRMIELPALAAPVAPAARRRDPATGRFAKRIPASPLHAH